MANSYVGNDDWGDSPASPSTVEQVNTSVTRGSWENEKALGETTKLEQLRRDIIDIQALQDGFKKSALELNETTKETKKMTLDMLHAVPDVRKIGENLMALTKVVKNDFTNVPLTVSPESYDVVVKELNGMVNSALDAAVDRCVNRVMERINEGINEGMQNTDRVEKHLEDVTYKFAEKVAANAQAKLDILQKKIDKKEEKIKQLEQKANGKFITDKQLAFLIAGYAFLLAAAVWGLSATVKREGASNWVVILLFIGLTSNFIFYALKYAWKGVKWLWNHIPGNND